MRNLPQALMVVLLLVSMAHAGDANLTWDAPTQNDDAEGSPLTDLAGYLVYYGTASGVYETFLDVGLATSAAISGLTPELTYFFAITAHDYSGNESLFSAEVSKTIPPDPPADVTPPEVAVISPAHGSTVARKSTVTIIVEASDDVAVAQVEIWVNGSLRCTDGIAPYTCAWKVPAANGKPHQLQAIAFDTAGNEGLSTVVQVTAQ